MALEHGNFGIKPLFYSPFSSSVILLFKVAHCVWVADYYIYWQTDEFTDRRSIFLGNTNISCQLVLLLLEISLFGHLCTHVPYGSTSARIKWAEVGLNYPKREYFYNSFPNGLCDRFLFWVRTWHSRPGMSERTYHTVWPIETRSHGHDRREELWTAVVVVMMMMTKRTILGWGGRT